MTFFAGVTALGTGTLQVVNNLDQATFTTAALGAGGHSITATYGGDLAFTGSTAAALSQTVAASASIVPPCPVIAMIGIWACWK